MRLRVLVACAALCGGIAGETASAVNACCASTPLVGGRTIAASHKSCELSKRRVQKYWRMTERASNWAHSKWLLIIFAKTAVPYQGGHPIVFLLSACGEPKGESGWPRRQCAGLISAAAELAKNASFESDWPHSGDLGHLRP
ncbi:hypothetical protein MRX96_031052 [Rhipicephalus microplus]